MPKLKNLNATFWVIIKHCAYVITEINRTFLGYFPHFVPNWTHWHNCYMLLRKRPVSMYQKRGKKERKSWIFNAFRAAEGVVSKALLLLTFNGFDGFLPEFGDVIVLQEKLFQASELSKSSRGHPFYVAVWQVEAHQLWNHLKGIGLHFLERIALQMQRTQVGNVCKENTKVYFMLNTY